MKYKFVGYTRDSKGIVVNRHLNDVCNSVTTSSRGGSTQSPYIYYEYEI